MFRKGAVASSAALTTNLPNSQVSVISTWDDGSVKHAVVAGRVDLTANTTRTVQFGLGSSGGTPLAEGALVAAAPNASVTYGNYGTVSLASLLGTSALAGVFNAGQHYAEFQYIAAFPNNGTLRAVFYVQLWSNNRYRVRVAVENGTAPISGTNASGTATVNIGGSQRFSGAVSMPQGTRWDIVAFDGADPAITPEFDVAYLRSTKLVPNYGWTSPSGQRLSELATTYTPMARLWWEEDMSTAGYQYGIGLLTYWDALFCTSADTRAYNAVIAHGRAAGTYSMFYRDTASRRMPRFSDHPTSYAGTYILSGNGTNSNRWEVAHHPNMGFLPWVLTGERFFWEVVAANAWAAYISNPNNSGGGTSRQFVGQTRAQAWQFRSIAAAAAIGPDADPIKADRRASVVANLNAWNATHVVPNTPATGLVATFDDKEGGQSGFQHSIFESLFLVAAMGWAWDVEMQLSTSDKATHQAVRNFVYRVPVGLTGRGPSASEYSWRRAPGPYRMTIGSSANLSSLYSSWNAVYQATYGDNLDSSNGQSMLEAYVNDSGFPYGNWGHLLTALAYAVDHGAAGAAEGWARVASASNWSSNVAYFNDTPQYGVRPR